MRQAFIHTLVELAEKDPRVVLLTGDLGYMVVEPFQQRFPDRFFNVGVAEQNMVGISTGLAESGFIPFVYSIVTFSVLRPYEFIRNGPILHQLPVRIVGMGAGFDYGHNGATHYGLEDVGVLRVQPGLNIVAPADSEQTKSALKATHEVPGPVYYRLSKDDKLSVPGLDGRFRLGHAESIREGKDVVIVSTGGITLEALKASDELAAKGISAGVLVVSSFNPAPVRDILAAAEKVPLVVTLEAHFHVGGLGSLVAEVMADNGVRSRLIRFGLRSTQDGISGSTQYLYERHQISCRDVVERVTNELLIEKIDRGHDAVIEATREFKRD